MNTPVRNTINTVLKIDEIQVKGVGKTYHCRETIFLRKTVLSFRNVFVEAGCWLSVMVCIIHLTLTVESKRGGDT